MLAKICSVLAAKRRGRSLMEHVSPSSVMRVLEEAYSNLERFGTSDEVLCSKERTSTN